LIIQKETKTVKIKTCSDLEKAVTLLTKIRKYAKMIEERRMEIARPILDGLKKLKADYDDSKVPYDEADVKLAEMRKDTNYNVLCTRVKNKGIYFTLEEKDFFEILNILKRNGII